MFIYFAYKMTSFLQIDEVFELSNLLHHFSSFFFFFNDTATTEIYTLSLHDALPIYTWDDQDYEYFFGDYLDDGYRPKAPQEVKELPPIENTLSTSSSLSDHLMWQLRSEEHTSELQSLAYLVCRLLLEKKKKKKK